MWLTCLCGSATVIVAGTAGYTDLGRGFFRMQGAACYINDGTQMTCLQDAIIGSARYAGHDDIVSSKVLLDLKTDDGIELGIDRAVCYVRETVRVPHTSPPRRIHEHAYPALPAPSSSDVDCSEPRVPCDLR